MPRVLITGASGFIGRHLAASFAATQNYQVLALHRSASPPAVSASRPIQWIRCDLARGLDNVPASDVIIHAAAAHPNARPVSGLTDYIDVNVLGTLRLMEYARRVGARFAFNLSTVSLYGDVPGGELTEKTPFFCPTMYGASKYAAELIIREFSDVCASLSVRLPGVVGPGYFTPWIGRVLSKALKGELISIFNPAAKFNNIVDVEELARLTAHILDLRPEGADVVNLGASEPSTIEEVVRRIVELTKSRSVVENRTEARGSFSIDITKLRERFSFTPQRTLAQVDRYVRANLGRKNQISRANA
jgi:nucleoside-diphosphate-sugar epimerase